MSRSSFGLFLAECRRNFTQTGALAPSSRALARAITSNILRGDAPRRILEAGPGTGVFTLEIARRMGPFDRLDVYEINSVFADHIEELLRTDPVLRALEGRLILHRKDVLEIPADAVYDRIVSGLPLNNFEPECVKRIFESFMSHLAPGGVFSYFEYVLVRAVKRCVSRSAERDRLRRVGEIAGEYVSRYQVRSDPVLLNLPPAVARHLVKPLAVKLPATKAARSFEPAAAVQ
jgi:phosphatidylethanolamine/phosphatidyl-N-methylethanolamine N-methyltransferase